MISDAPLLGRRWLGGLIIDYSRAAVLFGVEVWSVCSKIQCPKKGTCHSCVSQQLHVHVHTTTSHQGRRCVCPPRKSRTCARTLKALSDTCLPIPAGTPAGKFPKDESLTATCEAGAIGQSPPGHSTREPTGPPQVARSRSQACPILLLRGVTNHRHRPPIFILSDVSINQSDCNNVQLFSDQVV